MLLSLQTVCCVILMFSTSIGSSMCFFSQMGCQCMNPTFTFTVVSDLGCIDAWIQYSPSLWSLTLIASMKYAASTSSSVDMEWSTSSHISIPSSIVFCVSSAPLKFLFCQQVWLHMCSFQSLDYTYTIVSRFFAINVFFELVTIVFPKTIRTKNFSYLWCVFLVGVASIFCSSLSTIHPILFLLVIKLGVPLPEPQLSRQRLSLVQVAFFSEMQSDNWTGCQLGKETVPWTLIKVLLVSACLQPLVLFAVLALSLWMCKACFF